MSDLLASAWSMLLSYLYSGLHHLERRNLEGCIRCWLQFIFQLAARLLSCTVWFMYLNIHVLFFCSFTAYALASSQWLNAIFTADESTLGSSFKVIFNWWFSGFITWQIICIISIYVQHLFSRISHCDMSEVKLRTEKMHFVFFHSIPM